MALDPNTKLAQIRDAMASGDWDSAVCAAAKFKDLGEFGEAIRRGKDAINNPELYKQLGFDLEEVRKEAINALKSKYSNSWKAIEAGKLPAAVDRANE